jgi:hypothetical protein
MLLKQSGSKAEAAMTQVPWYSKFTPEHLANDGKVGNEQRLSGHLLARCLGAPWFSPVR